MAEAHRSDAPHFFDLRLGPHCCHLDRSHRVSYPGMPHWSVLQANVPLFLSGGLVSNPMHEELERLGVTAKTGMGAGEFLRP
jgi:hypothetical protein